MLHRLFVYEPQWNPNPSIHAAWLFAVLLPLAQTLFFAPALLLAEPGDNPECLNLEWSVVLLGSLAISTLPAGYHFTLLILPVCLMWSAVEKRLGLTGITVFLALYAAIGYPGWKTIGAMSPWALLSVPRLYLVVALCFFAYWLLASQKQEVGRSRDRWMWAGAFLLLMLLNIASGLRRQNELYADYQWRLPTEGSTLQANGPAIQNDTILFTAMVPTGYRTGAQGSDGIHFGADGGIDQLAVATTSDERWTEEAGGDSRILSSIPGRETIHKAKPPAVSSDGRWLAYLREERVRDSIWLRALDQPGSREKRLTPAEMNVMEMSFLPNGSLIYSAESNGGSPGLFLVDQAGSISSLSSDEARYPAVSPNGHWLAFSKLQNGNCHLWLRDLHDGQTSRLTHADCNSTEPAWASDSETLVYASDCGRALWFAALCRRRIPQ